MLTQVLAQDSTIPPVSKLILYILHDEDRPLGKSELGSFIGLSERTIDRHLEPLLERQLVFVSKIGHRVVITTDLDSIRREKTPEELYQDLQRAAWKILNEAVRNGNLIRPTGCSQCKRTDRRICGHHRDYHKPLEVVWLCESCHAKLQRFENEAYLTFEHKVVNPDDKSDKVVNPDDKSDKVVNPDNVVNYDVVDDEDMEKLAKELRIAAGEEDEPEEPAREPVRRTPPPSKSIAAEVLRRNKDLRSSFKASSSAGFPLGGSGESLPPKGEEFSQSGSIKIRSNKEKREEKRV